MYFSKIELRKEIRIEKIAQLLRGDNYGYRFHQHIWQLFKSENGKRDFIYREENREKWPSFYTISQRQPRENSETWDIKIKEFAPKLSVGQPLFFILRANPLRTKDKFDNGKRRRVRCDVVMDAKKEYKNRGIIPPHLGKLMQEEGEKWLQARMLRHGFEIQQVRVEGYQQHRLFKKLVKKPIQFSTLDFEGVLIVRDVEIFLNSLYSGIGSARGFGCGMMLIRRV